MPSTADTLQQDQRTLRSLAQRWMELACLPVMGERIMRFSASQLGASGSSPM